MLDFLKTVIFSTKIILTVKICNLRPIYTIFCEYQTFTFVNKQFLAFQMDSDIHNIRLKIPGIWAKSQKTFNFDQR